MNKLYTKQGDDGSTSTYSGKRLQKSSCLIRINGAIDSLQAQLMKLIPITSQFDELNGIYDNLMWIAAELSMEAEPKQSIDEKDVQKLESMIDDIYVELTGFIKFTNTISIEFNEARVRCRDAERKIVDFSNEHNLRPVCSQYLNRLSDLFFAYAVFMEDKRFCCMPNCNEQILDDGEMYVCRHCKGGKNC